MENIIFLIRLWNRCRSILQSPYRKIQEALQQINITQMRFQFLTAKAGFTIINDAWNASPSSMKAAIETLQKLNAYKKNDSDWGYVGVREER